MAKYSEELVEKIVSLMEEDTYSITEICKTLRITRKSFYEWKDTKPEFKEAIENAQAVCDERLQALARRSLRRKLEGYTMTEVRTVYTPDEDDPSGWKVKTRIVKEREYAPDDKAIRFVLRDKSSKEDELKNSQATLNITVTNQEASTMLTNLSKNLKGAPSQAPSSSPLPASPEWGGERKVEIDCSEEKEVLESEIFEEGDEAVSSLEKKKEKGKKKILVRDYCLPPGYLYRVEEVDEEE
ncbi:MAG: hypothetical protein E6767_12670 [Dysgonomonas sp.]|nr:hypothetical protein [Dysgonomonas sp.]